MGLLTSTIDKAEELLGHSPHPAIVALPLGTFAASGICDGLAVMTGREAYDDAARINIGIGLVGALAAAATGLRDYGYIPTDHEPNHQIATTHGVGNVLMTSLFAASYVLRDRDRRQGRRPCATARLLGLAGAALGTYTGWLGGKLVYEYGEAVQPLMHQESAAEKPELEAEPQSRILLESGAPARSE